MKRKLSTLLVLTLLFSMFCTTFASATEVDIPAVRVNGYLVHFTDAQPFIDENNRTMMPLRAVSEQLGALVTWDESIATATIVKNDISIDVTIGKETLEVTENESTTIVTMDTEAIKQDNRTYVPIRFVAEALGAYVDYSDYFNVVGIYQDVLSAEQIETLRAYPHTQSVRAISYEQYKKEQPSDKVDYFYNQGRESFLSANGYANSREFAYKNAQFSAPQQLVSLDTLLESENADEYYDMIIREAVAEFSISTENISLSFITDSSCVYQEDDFTNLAIAIRGYLVMEFHNVEAMTPEEIALAFSLGFDHLLEGKTAYIPADVHMATAYDLVEVHTTVALDTFEFMEVH